MAKSTTDVIFRIMQDGTAIAIFPELVSSPNPYYCLSYTHYGQHGDCDPNYMMKNSYKTDIYNGKYNDSVESLRKELSSIGYNLKEVKRNTSKYLYIRRKELGYK